MYKRFGPVDAKGNKAVDVNLDAVKAKGYKSIEELSAEPGNMFGHLSPADRQAAYEELGAEIGISKSTAAPAKAASTPS